MKAVAKDGLAKLSIPALPLDSVLVTYFDVSLGKTSEGSAQRGESHFLASPMVLKGVGKATLPEFHSNKITRVVKSSMAAESGSMTAAANRLIFNQKLMDALSFGWNGRTPHHGC